MNRSDECHALFELQRTLYTSGNPTRRWLHRSRRDWIVAAINNCSVGVERALEIGPGSGVYLPALARVAADVVAADVENAYLERLTPLANQYANVSLVFDDITRSTFPDQAFDLILCSEVVEHVRESARAFAEIHRLLRPNGVLILSTPQRFSSLELCAKIAFRPGVIDLVRRIYREPILETGHINLMTRRELGLQLADADLVAHATYTAGVYVPIVAELLGQRALRFERALESRLRGSRLEWLLWTQFVIAKRSSAAKM